MNRTDAVHSTPAGRSGQAWEWIAAHDAELRAVARALKPYGINDYEDYLHNAYILTVDRLNLASNPRSYILTKAWQLSQDAGRQVGRRATCELDPEIIGEGHIRYAQAVDVEETAIAAIVLDSVWRCFATLPLAQRTAMTGRMFGYSDTEIAARMGAPLGTTKTRIRMAVAKLREAA